MSLKWMTGCHWSDGYTFRSDYDARRILGKGAYWRRGPRGSGDRPEPQDMKWLQESAEHCDEFNRKLKEKYTHGV